MSKYVAIKTSAAAGIMGSRGCGQFEDAAYVNDPEGQGCWAIKGTKIPKGDLYVGIQEAWERVNAMFQVEGTQYPLPTYTALNASTMSTING